VTSEDLPLGPDLVSKIRDIHYRAKYLVNESFSGEYESAFKGKGLEFLEVREYTPGDDVRQIDWNVTARAGSPFVKLHRDERELTVMLLVDVSGSFSFGTKTRLKNDLAAEVSALLAYTALSNNDKVGLIVFSDKVEHFLPPKKGKGYVWKLIWDIFTHQSHSRKTDLNAALEYLNRVIKKKAIVFVISDFLYEGFEKNLQISSRKHDVIAIKISDPAESSMADMGYIRFKDSETGEMVIADTHSWKGRQEFTEKVRNREKSLAHLFLKTGVDSIYLETGRSYLDDLVKFFKMREKRF